MGTGFCVPNRAHPNLANTLSVDAAACPRFAPCRSLDFFTEPNRNREGAVWLTRPRGVDPLVRAGRPRPATA